jgi:hypothetical protein
VLDGLTKLDKFNGETFVSLPTSIQQHIRTRPLKVVTLNDKSDTVVRFDLFERLNTGGIILTKQEIRACVYQGPFADMLERLSKTDDFKKVVKLTDKQKADGTAEECVLRFFAYLNKYESFEHSVTEFLNDYMKANTKTFNIAADEQEFTAVLAKLAVIFPIGIMRSERKGRTPLNLFEAIAVGAALAIRQNGAIETHNLNEWVGSLELRRFTSGATNDRAAVRGRIEFCKERFLGTPYVRAADDGN